MEGLLGKLARFLSKVLLFKAGLQENQAIQEIKKFADEISTHKDEVTKLCLVANEDVYLKDLSLESSGTAQFLSCFSEKEQNSVVSDGPTASTTALLWSNHFTHLFTQCWWWIFYLLECHSFFLWEISASQINLVSFSSKPLQTLDDAGSINNKRHKNTPDMIIYKVLN